ncbi:hypothetical protein TWF481_012269 [Arthrobotrys musiformis]|uniref:Uncharacterized protein n=1 Tax=Arthrobotrys musiformis TaxID=47236 RepID=A0AAV9VWH6_9PEZI
MPGSFIERAPYRVPTATSPSETIKIDPEDLSVMGIGTSSTTANQAAPGSLHKHPCDDTLSLRSTPCEVTVNVNLVATNRLVEVILGENQPLEAVLQVVKPRILAVFFEQSGYFAPNQPNALAWTIDLTFGDLSILNMVNLLTYRGEPQETLLVKDIFYGGETLEPRIFRLTSPQDSGAPGPPIEFKWSQGAKEWIAQPAPGEMLLMDAQLAVHENILYTPFTHARGSLSLTSMKLCYLRTLNERLRTPASSVGYVSAVVFVGIGDIRMAVVKSYAWKKDPSKGLGQILDWDDRKGIALVRDGTGQDRTLKFRRNRLVWVEEVA